MVTLYIPTPLRPYTEGRETVQVEASTVGEALRALAERYPRLQPHLFTEEGRLRSFVNVYLGEEDVRHLQGEATPVREADELFIIPSVAGGSPDAPVEVRTQPDLIPPERLAQVSFTQEEILRYSRHLILPDVTLEGQARLKAARVLLIGAGGLGSPLALYLAAAGVGTLGIVDFDRVDETNLQRQVIHTTDDVGRSKVRSAAEKVRALNPHVQVIPYEEPLTRDNALEILSEYDVIVDGTDNFPTRYLVNDACVLLGKPLVYGSIFRFEGQATVFYAKAGPCYRCLYPEAPPPELVPSCAEGGVLGVLPGLIGLVQATEAVKLILGRGEPLIGRLLLLDALKMRWRELRLRKDPNCPLCGERPTIRELLEDYPAFCGLSRGEEDEGAGEEVPQLGPQELARLLAEGRPLLLLDVREPHELQISRLPGVRNVPLAELVARIHELDLDPRQEIVCICRTGGRSARAVRFLRGLGYRARNLQGGMNAYAREVDPSLPVY